MGCGWFVLVTLTTVGYGDRYPLTSAGQIITSFAIICGVLFTAMPNVVLKPIPREVGAPEALRAACCVLRVG